MKNKGKGTNVFLPKVGEWWGLLCLNSNPLTTRLYDFLQFRAAKENVALEEYIRRYDITLEPIRVDVVSLAWLAMGIAYNRFNKAAQSYDHTIEFKEYFGERAFFGLLREYIITATGLRYNKKPIEPCNPD